VPRPSTFPVLSWAITGHCAASTPFDAFIRKYGLNDPALDRLALIVRGADTDSPDLASEAAGLVALSWGLNHNHQDDHELLAQGMVIYDALYAWCAPRPTEAANQASHAA